MSRSRNDPHETEPVITTGAVIAGRYLIQAPIGRGGMASVWRAQHLNLKRPVAIKFLDLAGHTAKAVRERFLREARLSAAVQHRYVVDILDFGSTAEGRAYMVMELIEGRSLGERLMNGPAVSLPECVRIVVRLLAGLAAVHEAGIVHGDLKPENILLVEEDGREDFPKLLDFGVSRATRRDPTERVRSVLPSAENVVAGTPQYMSPEQAMGDRMGPTSDLFCVGTILYELLTGVLPFDGPEPLIALGAVQRATPVPLSEYRKDLAPALTAVVEKAMQKAPADRFATATEMRAALLSAAASHAQATRTSPGAALLEGDSTAPPDAALEMWQVVDEQDDGPRRRQDLPTADNLPAANHQPAANELPAASRRRFTAVGVVVFLLGLAATVAMIARSRPEAMTVTELPAPEETSSEPSSARTLRLDGVPEHARIWVDGAERSEPPSELPISEGAHRIVVRLDDGREWTTMTDAHGSAAFSVALTTPATPSTPAPTGVRPEASRPHAPTPVVRPAHPSPRRHTSAAEELVRDPGF